MLRLSWGLVVGLFLLVAGISVLAKEAFGIEVPVFRIAFAVFLLYGGISILAGTAGYRAPMPWDQGVVFGTAQFDARSRSEMSAVFGRATLDLTELEPPRTLTLNVIFGDAVVRYDPAIPLRIVSTTAFGGTDLPDGQQAPFGERVWTLPAWRSDLPAIEVKTNVVFGHLGIETVPAAPLSIAPRTP